MDASRGTTKPLAGTFFYVLLALADQQRYGLDIMREVSETTGDSVRLGPGTLYNAIGRMLDEGLIEETGSEGEDPRRRYYRITELGRRRLMEETTRLQDLVTAVHRKEAPA